MKYNSLREYFYKLHNPLYVMILIPLLVFIVLYWQMREGNIMGALRDNVELSSLMLIVFCLILITDWIASFFLFRKALKAIRTLGSLGEKLERYYVFTMLRFALVVSGSLALAIGFYLTENMYSTVLAVTNLLLILLYWPTPAKVCNDLQLKGDERTLILYKKDRL